MNVLGLFIHSAKQDVLLKAELKRLMLLAIAKGGTCVTIIEDDYSRSHGAHVPETFEGTTAVLENHIANKLSPLRPRCEPSVRTAAECLRVHFIESSMYSKSLTSYTTRTPTIKLLRSEDGNSSVKQETARSWGGVGWSHKTTLLTRST